MVDHAAPVADDPITSQASSHFPLEPISADVLLRRETKRRDALREMGRVRTGCRGVDEYVLAGGFERGSVVGISAENEQLGVLISMQAVAKEVCGGDGSGESRVMVVTAQPPPAVLPTLRDAVKAELAVLGVPAAEVKGRLRSCLERVSVSRVFDFDGLWEVLGDLDIPPGSPSADGSVVSEDDGGAATSQEEDVVETEAETVQEVLVLPDLKPEPRYHPQTTTKTEIADSDEEEAFSPPASSSSELSELSPPPSSMASMLATPEPHENPEVSDHREPSQERQIVDAEEEEISMAAEEPIEDQNTKIQSPTKRDEKASPPDIILITHFSALMTALFTRLDRTSAHDSLQSLSDYLRYLSRSLSSSPLIILLNSTSSSKSKTLTRPDPAMDQGEAQPPPAGDGSPAKNSVRPIDPSLCSIFHPPPLDIHGYNNQTLSRRNKPTFGLVFSQFLDLHILCTRVPSTKEDGEMVYAEGRDDVGFTWVVEVLLDEMGVWGEEGPQGSRRCREQRWTPVEVAGGRVVDAFAGAAEKKRNVGDVRTVGGFGGPRV
ncbi:hypothetical protein CkaCkLH20_03168 [Colletotrichum karsti]|uniref:Fasciclin domain family n=1 Tax=Colletotrichum karsti TaxID=1095194 RepID=A0A9P6II41_9PEZI|nr:uncharacterized protein CkaCkLH20_03168 [Colletotrichum karsti]KAF9879625.1 hypothetical protein CkaCkLH20_03168 [Colletotrichum karsti]